MEVVWEQYFAHHFATTVSAFYYPIHSLIGERIDPANQNTFFANTGSLDLRGLDLELKRSLAAGLEATLSYSFQDASSPNPANQITNSPRHLVQASASAPIVKQKIFASMDLQYVGSRTTDRPGGPGIPRPQLHRLQPQRSQALGNLRQPL
jgi:outer membrane receptor protein involved in Fe transport